MIIREIDKDKCDGCGSCERTCMGDVIQMREGKAYIAYAVDCTGCMWCELLCPRQAIEVGRI